MRIRPKNEKNFGTLEYSDGSSQMYEAYEIVFKTPAEHKINNKYYDMEV